jgi:CHAT domain-containing protein
VVVEERSKAGLQQGDRIISYDGKTISSPAAFDALQQNTFGKNEIVLQVQRGGESLNLTVPLGALGIEVRPELPASALTSYEEGKVLLKAGKTKEAAAHWKAAARSAQEAWLFNRAGEILENPQLWKEAVEAHLAAWELLKDGSDGAAKSRTLSALGWCHENLNNLAAAARSYEQARQEDVAAGNETWVAENLQSLGTIALTRGDLPAAQDYYNRDLAIWEQLRPNSYGVFEGLEWLADFARRRGDLPAAQDYAARALTIAERLYPNSQYVAGCFSALGLITSLRGDSLAAEYYYSEALSIIERLQPNSRWAAIRLRDLARAALARNDYQAAQHYLSRSLEINETVVPNSLAVAEALDDLGLNAASQGDFEAAEKYQKRALAIQERWVPDSLALAVGLNKLGRVARYRHDLAAAEDYEKHALAIQERLEPNSIEAGNSLNELGHIAFERGDLAEAQNLYNRALHIFEQSASDSVQLVGAVADLGALNLREQHFREARTLFERAVEVLESRRGRIGSAEARAFLVAQFKAAYEGLIQSLVALDDLPGAFGASERARARSLVDLLSEARVDVRQGVEPALLARERQLQERLNANAEAQTKLLSGKHSAREAEAAAKEIDTVTTEYHEVEASIRAVSPHYAALTRPQPLTLAEMQWQVLDKDSLLLEYSLGEEASFLFAVTQDSIKSYRLPGRAQIEALARQTYEALTARNKHSATETAQQRNARILKAEDNYPNLATRLSQMILAPAVPELGAKRLVIVADGDLLQIPFGALADPAESNEQALILNHEIVSLPSASVIAIQRQELANRKPAVKQLALFADPVFEQNDERVTAMTRPENARDVSLERAMTEAAIGDDRSKIQRLPFSRTEAHAILAFTRRDDSLKALDFDASKSMAMSSELSRYRILHFATHALLNNDHPELSGIVLSLIDRQGRSVDGFLRLNEIYNLNLSADLVVLSACETGLGKQIKEEGLIGLARGFMGAGAQRVVSSLWKVDDEATAELMSRFYQKMLKEGEPPSAALRHAQIDMSREKRWRAAYFWAGFQMAGEWR